MCVVRLFVAPIKFEIFSLLSLACYIQPGLFSHMRILRYETFGFETRLK